MASASPTNTFQSDSKHALEFGWRDHVRHHSTAGFFFLRLRASLPLSETETKPVGRNHEKNFPSGIAVPVKSETRFCELSVNRLPTMARRDKSESKLNLRR